MKLYIMKVIPAIVLMILLASCKNPTPDTTADLPAKENKPPNILFLIADDWSYPHASIYGDPVVKTPTFDFLAENGAVFSNAFCASPSCTTSRAAILTGRYPHQLESAGNLWSILPNKFPNWVSILAGAGYFAGSQDKGWGPGDFKRGGYEHNPAGKPFENFDAFMSERPDGQPFCYWFGSTDPHRTYEANAGVRTGMKLANVMVPGFMPDLACIRNDILDYYFEVERFDRRCGNILKAIEEAGELENTLVVITSDNGMPFPRAKANLYDYGTRMPLAIYWPDQIKAGLESDDFINAVDLGPTLLAAAGITVPEEMSGESLLNLATGKIDDADRKQVYLERERHANVRKGDLSYPMRAIRNADYLYIRNFMPDRNPAGDPEAHISVGQYGDIDNSISKFLIMDMEGQSADPNYFELVFGKRPAEELYVLADDPYQLNNVANQPEHANVQKEMSENLAHWMASTGDLRATNPETIYWDTVTYTPNYDYDNFDLQANITAYKMLEQRPFSRFDTVACK